MARTSSLRKHKKYSVGSTILTIVFVVVCLAWIMPVIEVLINSFKSNDAINTDVFALPRRRRSRPLPSRRRKRTT